MKIKVGDIEVLYIKIVKVFDVDRRVVKEIVGMIFKVFELRDIYMNFELIVYMKYVGRYVGYGVIEIEFELRVVGIFVKIVQKIVEYDINIIQVVVEDFEFYFEVIFMIIIERFILGDLINEFFKFEGVKRIFIYQLKFLFFFLFLLLRFLEDFGVF